jgi:hypothetical protein
MPGLLGPRPDRARRAHTTPPVLAPDQASRAPEGGQVDQLHRRPLLDRHRTSAAGAGGAIGTGLDVDPHWPAHLLDDPEHPHRRQSDQQLAHARRVHLHRGSPDLDGFDTIKLAEPLLRAGDDQTPLISEGPGYDTMVHGEHIFASVRAGYDSSLTVAGGSGDLP